MKSHTVEKGKHDNMKYFKITAIALFSSLFAFVAIGEIRQMGQGNEKQYSVVKNKHDFRPNAFPIPYFGAKEYQFSVRFEPSCWFGIEDQDYQGGNDVKDWNKIGGMTNYLSANNKQSVLFAWRPDTAYMVIQVTAYTNDSKGGFVAGEPATVKVGDYVEGKIKWFGNTAYYYYGDQVVKHKSKKTFIIREIGPWFGGNQTAHKDMYLHLARRIR